MTADEPSDEPRTIRFARRSVGHLDASSMLKAFYADQVARYGYADPVDLDPEEYETPNGVFAVAYLGGEPVGCGGCHWYDRESGTAEIKKTYIAPRVRGFGAGKQLLLWLEAQAEAWGARRLILETGVRNSAALALFVGNGYRPVASYVEHRDPRINRAFTKLLSGTSNDAAGFPPR